MNVAREVGLVRQAAGVFVLDERGLLEISGSDSRRWLNGMVSNDIASLREGPEHSGCPALVLSNKGRILAECHVLGVGESFWIELRRELAAPIAERLGRFVIADDVTIADRSNEIARFGVEGPRAGEAVEVALGRAFSDLAPGACVRWMEGESELVVARFGWSGEDSFQVFIPLAAASAVRSRLERTAPIASARALEVLRIEAGIPRSGAELSEEILPPEARLEASISYTKGCYTGQEIVARLRSRGHVNHLLVGLRFEGDPPERGTPLDAKGKRVGEITSAAVSPHAGAIGLGFVRVGHDEPGTVLDAGARRAVVAALPLVGVAGRET